MRRLGLSLAILLLTCTLFSVIPQYARNAANQSSQDGHARRSIAVNLLRAINTAEYDYKFKHGSFASWDTLFASEQLRTHGMQWAAQNEPQLAGAQLSKGPEIFPGWLLRLNLVNSGTGYDVELEDATDKACHYAASSDERALIRQSKTIDCEL